MIVFVVSFLYSIVDCDCSSWTLSVTRASPVDSTILSISHFVITMPFKDKGNSSSLCSHILTLHVRWGERWRLRRRKQVTSWSGTRMLLKDEGEMTWQKHRERHWEQTWAYTRSYLLSHLINEQDEADRFCSCKYFIFYCRTSMSTVALLDSRSRPDSKLLLL